MPQAWSKKRERRYEHIREGAKDQLYNESRRRNIKGRSSMSKKYLQNALGG